MSVMQNLKPFDSRLAVLEDYLDGSMYPARLDAHEVLPLSEALAAQIVSPDTHLLAFEQDNILHTFPMSVVLCYNVIQGQTNDTPWMMTFCNACNTGMVFDPVLNGQTLHFRRRGSYDGLLLIWDEETNSYWQHITGKCLYGISAGQQLRTRTLTRHMTAAEALARNMPSVLLTGPLTAEQQTLSRMMEKMRAKPEKVESGIVSTISQEDTRRPRFELGLGVWNQSVSTFFPLVLLHTYDNALMTTFDGRSLLIYQAPGAIAPTAVYLETKRAHWQDDILRLDNGAYIQHDLYFTADGQSPPLESPMQLLMRWYGFALTFPGCIVAIGV
jgi:hypothetical protein